ncbi:RNA-directed DNA polymerase, eukaryota, reverse transcriptase zinc-binding domain protein [Tanacetum coccineum]
MNEIEVSDGGSKTEVNYGINIGINTEIEGSDGCLRCDGDGKIEECGEKSQEDCLSNSDKVKKDEVQSNLKDTKVIGDEVLKDNKEAVDKRNKSYANVVLEAITNFLGNYLLCQLKLMSMDIHVCLDKKESEKLPIWIRLCNVPLEAWTTNGIIALATRLGKPLVMDNVTYEMCKIGVGRLRFARVLVEVSTKKSLPHEIEVVYRDKNKEEVCGKNKLVENNDDTDDKKMSPNGSGSKRKTWSVHEDILAGLKKYANKYFVLKELNHNQDTGDVNDVYEDVNGISQCMENDIIECIDRGGYIMLIRDLRLYNRVVGNNVWAIMGDMNVTLDPKEHSAGSSAMSKDMIEFKECVNEIEVEDVTSSGLFFTWTKNLYKTRIGENSSILKKLNRVMGNEALICKYPQAHAIFLPYLILDHCLVVLVIPNSMQARKKAFRFANSSGEKLKALIKPLKDLAWKTGDLFKNVKDLRDRLKEVQAKIDEDPSNNILREEESSILVLRSRNHRIRVNAIHDDDGRRYEGDQLIIEEAKLMVRDVSIEEIKQSLFQIDDNKALGPDGFFAHFYKKDTIEEFRKVYGLLPNYNKSTIIFGSVKEYERKEILEFKVEKLHARYLRVPLISKRNEIKECKSLIDKIRNKILSWKNKCLSYAGRLQLVASVLESIHVYWAIVFLLPQVVIDEINSLLKGFLWNQEQKANGRAKVAWKNLCKPKSQGGLGLKNLSSWNKAMISGNGYSRTRQKESHKAKHGMEKSKPKSESQPRQSQKSTK